MTTSIDLSSGQARVLARDDLGIGSIPGTSLSAVHDLLLSKFAGQNIRIYEAGGGSMSYLPQELIGRAEKTVVDIEEKQLRKNFYAEHKICGDIQRAHFRRDSFDLVVCYNVIEHLERPDQAIAHFYDALVAGGLVFIAAPNPLSFSGMVTKFTPHWFHVWFYRRVLKNKDAGQPGAAPFRTIYHPVVSPPRLMQFCRQLGFEIVYYKEFETVQYNSLKRQRPAIAWMLNAFLRAWEFVLRRDLRNGDFHIVLEKPRPVPSR
jgi:SAM-dependent methyltransferase